MIISHKYCFVLFIPEKEAVEIPETFYIAEQLVLHKNICATECQALLICTKKKYTYTI